MNQTKLDRYLWGYVWLVVLSESRKIFVGHHRDNHRGVGAEGSRLLGKWTGLDGCATCLSLPHGSWDAVEWEGILIVRYDSNNP